MPAYVLVVDDDPSILTVVTEILLDQGYRVAAARNAQEALRRIEDPPHNGQRSLPRWLAAATNSWVRVLSQAIEALDQAEQAR